MTHDRLEQILRHFLRYAQLSAKPESLADHLLGSVALDGEYALDEIRVALDLVLAGELATPQLGRTPFDEATLRRFFAALAVSAANPMLQTRTLLA